MGGAAAGTVGEVEQRTPSLISRIAIGVLLALLSILIPGEADRYLETPLTWRELFPVRPRSRASSTWLTQDFAG
jgi:hypothetical protein